MPESYGKPDLNSKPRNETDSQNAAFRSRTDGRLPAGGDRPGPLPPDAARPYSRGVVYGDGAPLAGVCVSDGVQFATTDAAGRYRIESDKSAGFVFAVTPSNWVAAEADGVQPLFWAALDEVDARDEQHDFHFASVDQSRYTVMFFTDLHLTNSSEKRDLDHYRSIALASISDEAAQASARGPGLLAQFGRSVARSLLVSVRFRRFLGQTFPRTKRFSDVAVQYSGQPRQRRGDAAESVSTVVPNIFIAVRSARPTMR